MSIIATVITIIVFPLNFLWALPTELKASGAEKQVTVENVQGEGGKVQGAEKTNEGGFFTEEAIPQSRVQPVKKEGVEDLDIAGAHSSLILDVDSGTILHYSNGRERRQIASLTKLMTASLVMEKVKNLDEEATIDSDEVYIEGTRIGCPRTGYCISQRLKVGEKISVLNLLKAMLMNSANDAAVALAKHVSGTEDEFVKLMNQKAEELGLKDTHFCTASGLEIDGQEFNCYSSAYDIARIAAYSMQYDLIWQIFRLPNNTVVTSADGTCTHQILNTDIVLNEIPNCLGGKTGFTPLAGNSLLLSATDTTKKHKIIAVVLDDPYRWQDIQTMLNWAFKSYEWK